MNSSLVTKSWGTELPGDVWTHHCAEGEEVPYLSTEMCKRNSANVQQQDKLTPGSLKTSAPLSHLINTQHFLGETADRESVCPGQLPTSSHLKCQDCQPLAPLSQQGQAPGTNLMGLELEHNMECVYTPNPCVCTHTLTRLGETITNWRITPSLWISTGSHPLRFTFCL